MGGRSLLVAGCVLAALLAGCGGSSTGSRAPVTAAVTSPTTQAQPSSTEDEQPAPPKLAPNPVKEPTEASVRPHPGARVARVIVHDVKRGTGPAVRPGDGVEMDYIESNWTSGHKFMRAWGGPPWPTAEVILRPDLVMRGLIIGMTGMRVGGHRRILVPRRLSDVNDSDRRGNSYKEIVYYDVVLRAITTRDGQRFTGR
jgi:hypothetical protein